MGMFLFLSFVYLLALNLLFATLVVTGFGTALFGGLLLSPLTIIAYPLLRLAPVALTRKEPGRNRMLYFYFVCLFFDALLFLTGIFGIRQSEISAAKGGGLLGGIGYVVCAAAVVFNLLSLVAMRVLCFFKKKSARKTPPV